MNKEIKTAFLLVVVAVLFGATEASAQDYTDEEVKEVYKEAYTKATLEAFEGEGMACVYIAERTKELCEAQGVEGYAIMARGHIIPVVELPSGGYYGGQYQFLYRFTSFNRNWRDKAIYSAWGGATNARGGATLKDRKIYDHADVFVDYVFIEELEGYKYLLKNTREYPMPEGN